MCPGLHQEAWSLAFWAWLPLHSTQACPDHHVAQSSCTQLSHVDQGSTCPHYRARCGCSAICGRPGTGLLCQVCVLWIQRGIGPWLSCGYQGRALGAGNRLVNYLWESPRPYQVPAEISGARHERDMGFMEGQGLPGL